MPLKRRQKSGTDLYHVIAKGINKERTFNQSREKTYLKKIIKKIQKKYENVEIYAYCIMSNHIHLILKAEFPELSLFMALNMRIITIISITETGTYFKIVLSVNV